MMVPSSAKLQVSWLLSCLIGFVLPATGFVLPVVGIVLPAIGIVLPAIGFVLPVSAKYSLEREGSHICQNIVRYQRPVTVAIRESYTQMYFIPCDDFFKLFMCSKTKSFYRVSYRQEFQQVKQTMRGCCPGFIQNDTLCTPCLRGTYGLNCTRTCPECLHGFGTCTPSDGSCTCLDGYHGQHCDKGCRRGWYGKNCLHRCQCPRHNVCNRMTGECHCRSRRCALLTGRGQVQILQRDESHGIPRNTASTNKQLHWTLSIKISLSVLLIIYYVYLGNT